MGLKVETGIAKTGVVATLKNGEGGGRVMVEEGLFERFPCDAVFGLHNAPRMPLGYFGIRSGPMLSASDFFDIKKKPLNLQLQRHKK